MVMKLNTKDIRNCSLYNDYSLLALTVKPLYLAVCAFIALCYIYQRQIHLSTQFKGYQHDT